MITGLLRAESEQVTATMRDRQRKAGWGGHEGLLAPHVQYESTQSARISSWAQ